MVKANREQHFPPAVCLSSWSWWWCLSDKTLWQVHGGPKTSSNVAKLRWLSDRTWIRLAAINYREREYIVLDTTGAGHGTFLLLTCRNNK